MSFLTIICWIMGIGAAGMVLLWLLACVVGPFLGEKTDVAETEW